MPTQNTHDGRPELHDGRPELAGPHGSDTVAIMSTREPATTDSEGKLSRRSLVRTAAVGGVLLFGASAVGRPEVAYANTPENPTLYRDAPEPTQPHHVATKNYVDSTSTALEQTLSTRIDNLDPEVSALTPTSGAVTINFAAEPLRTHNLTGNVTYTASNLAAGKSVTILVNPGASLRGVAFPAGWKFVSLRPSSIAAGKTAALAVTSFGTTDAQCIAAWAGES